ncbi:hypothetical protein [Cryobacterium sp. TMT3-29-2]|uniref:hypothetical protein n=1 Tax=Cryobacterium sp. TMT3-29-2 TaxID=2555867 RepID=UPI0010738C33|nr:hypothetical protein [Cryobacterium sp. TMT3-29-2]TFC86613.1 hypothetical protein E3O67_10390 [Cryobacterium sp. TMT3-29-2]
MEFLFGGIVIGAIGAGIYAFIVFTGLLLGFPMERKGAQAKRDVIAKQMRQNSIEVEAARNVAIKAAEKRMGV